MEIFTDIHEYVPTTRWLIPVYINTYTYGLLKWFDLILYILKIEIIKNSYSLSPPPPNNSIKKREELMSRKIIKVYFYFSITDTKIGF